MKGGAASPNDSGIHEGTSIKIPQIPSDLQPIELGEGVLLSAMLNEEENFKVVSTFFAAKADLNKEGMEEYGLKSSNDRQFEKNKSSKNLEVEYVEKFDSRGKKIRIKIGKIAHPPLQKLGYSFAVVNFHPQTLITQSDLKQRANSMVYNKYKQIKRDIAKRE